MERVSGPAVSEVSGSMYVLCREWSIVREQTGSVGDREGKQQSKMIIRKLNPDSKDLEC